MASIKEHLITTIIPTYRRPELLRKAIQSVLNQTFPDFLIYVCDNASGDETASVVSELSQQDSRVNYYCHSENIGAIPNFNFGMKQVKTPFFSLLADDNTLLPNFFEDAINTLTAHPEATLFAGRTVSINEKGQKIGSSLLNWESGLFFPPLGLLNIWEKGLLTWESVLFRSKVLQSIGFLDPSVNPSTDPDFMMRIARKHTIYVSKKPYAIFLRHEKSWAYNRDLAEVVSSWTRIAKIWLHDEELSESIKSRIRKAYKKRLVKAITNNLYTEGIKKNNPDVLHKLANIRNKDFEFSFKTFRTVVVVKLAQQHELFRRLILGCSEWYIQSRRKLSNFSKEWHLSILN